MFRRLTAVAFSVVTLLVGCGGSGDDDDGDNLTAITAQNAQSVSSVVFRAASGLFAVAVSEPLEGVAGVVADASTPSARLGLLPFAAGKVTDLKNRKVRTSAVAVGVVYEETLPCADGGTETIRLNDADNNDDVSTGDSFSVTYANCQEDGMTSNGRLAIDELVVESETSYRGRVSFDGFRVNEGSDVFGADGSLTLVASENPGSPASYQVSGTRFSTVWNGDVHGLTDFSGNVNLDYVQGTTSYSFDGGVTDQSNNVSVVAQTLSAFAGSLSGDYPSSGSMRITGRADSRALLEALSTVQVRISVDEQGDGTYESSFQTTWEDLEAAPN